MRKIFLVFVLNLALVLIGTNCYATNWCEDTNVETCWTIETGSGTTWDDKSSNNLDATLEDGDPSFIADVPDSDDGFNGISNWSMDFDGNDGMQQATYDVDANTITTFVLWSKIDTLNSTDRWFAWNVTNYGFLQFEDKPDWWANGFDLYADADDIVEGEWTHYALVFNETASTAKLYVNGALKETDTSIGSQSSDRFKIGQASNDQSQMDGKIDEFAIFSRELDITEINNIMENGLIQISTASQIIPVTFE